MIADLKPYPTMKDSGVPWLGAVPFKWKIARNGSLFGQRNETGFADLPILEVSLKTGVRVRNFNDNGRKQVMADREKYKRAHRGDLAYNMMRLWQGAIGVSPVDGLVSPAYVVARPFQGVESKFFEYLFRTDVYMGEVDKFSHGIVKDRNRLYWEEFKQMPSPVPPPAEQAAIVRFLDHTDRRIQRYIRAKKTLIKLLEEQRQAIIHRAITRGVDPNIRLKSSGVEWLGDVPEPWGITRLKFIASEMVDCLHATPVYSEAGKYPAIRTADVQPGRLLVDSARRVDEEILLRWTARMAPGEGDILYTREGERFGIAALVPDGVRLCISQRMMVFRIHPAHNSAYVMWQINCRHVYAQAATDLIGAAAPHVNVERIKNFWLVLPPKPEQDRIIAAVAMENATPDVAIAKAQRGISLLRECRTRLISDVVTGKLDVREASTRLPCEAEELDQLDEADALSDAGDDVVDDLDAVPEDAEA